jgi:hypothetical protein
MDHAIAKGLYWQGILVSTQAPPSPYMDMDGSYMARNGADDTINDHK